MVKVAFIRGAGRVAWPSPGATKTETIVRASDMISENK
jgi:hypothetical protein